MEVLRGSSRSDPCPADQDIINDSNHELDALIACENGNVCLGQIWRCVFCQNADLGASGKKVMPCLHIACTDCLHREAKLNSLPGSQSIISCRECNYKVKFLHDDISNLKGIPKSLAVPNNAAEPNGSNGDEELQDYLGVPHCCDDIIVDGVLIMSSVVHCDTCDMLVCERCRQILHPEHPVTALPHMIHTKQNYMRELLEQIASRIQRHHVKVSMVDTVKSNVGKLRDDLQNVIDVRSDYLIEMINKRRESMMDELEKIYVEYIASYDSSIERLNDEVDTMISSYEFASKVIHGAIDDDILLFHNDITNRLTYLNHKIKEAQIEILNMELDIPDRGREESYSEKLFGSLIRGNVICGDAELVSSFLIDLQWPSSLAATSPNTFVVAGKTGAFESHGKLCFYNRQGALVQQHVFVDGRIPYDVICAPNGCLWVSDNQGQVVKFSSSGIVLETWSDKFKGGGHLAMTPKEELLVSSLDDKAVFKYDRKGLLLQTIPPSNSFNLVPHCIASNATGDIIIADHQAGAVFVFDPKGVIQFKFGGNDIDGALLKCPSDVCSDPFNNILVADFTNDRVLLISKTGQLLGYLLTTENGISCPNFISLDQEGHLFVGQYGGDIHVFRYLSYVKNA